MSVTGIDIAWDRPTIAQILATGAKWVARYLSPDSTKNITAAEVHDYPANGLGIVVVWEGTATRALAGRAAGVADAQAAAAQCAAVGLPTTMVIHFAVDTDTDWPSVSPYFDGVRSVLGDARTGVYGGLKVINGAHAAGLKFLWQTVAWSGGVWSPYATIRQPGGTTLSGGADYDTAEVADFGQYPHPEADMPLTQTDANLVAQTLLNMTVPNQFRLDAKGAPSNTPVSAFLTYGDHHFDVLSGQLTALATAASAEKAELDAIKTTVGSVMASLQALSSAANPTVAEVQSAITAEIQKLGAALGGIK